MSLILISRDKGAFQWNLPSALSLPQIYIASVSEIVFQPQLSICGENPRVD